MGWFAKLSFSWNSKQQHVRENEWRLLGIAPVDLVVDIVKPGSWISLKILKIIVSILIMVSSFLKEDEIG